MLDFETVGSDERYVTAVSGSPIDDSHTKQDKQSKMDVQPDF